MAPAPGSAQVMTARFLTEPLRRRLVLCFLAGTPIGFGIASILVRQSYNWDLLNYHFYNPFAWLHGRHAIDIDAPVVPGAYFNPLLHLPLYLAINTLPPRLTGFMVGAVQGLNALLVFAIARLTLPPMPSELRDIAAIALGLFGAFAAGNLGELGTMFGDNVLSVAVLAGLLVLLTGAPVLAAASLFQAISIAIAAGVLVGLAAGLKPTMWIYGVGLGCAALTAPAPPARRLAVAAAVSLGLALGVAISGGFWMATLWQRYGNPLFPFFNHVFASPWGHANSHFNLHYQPKSLIDAVALPFRYPTNAKLVGEIRFVDLRVPLLYALGWVTGAAMLWRLARGSLGTTARPDHGRSAMVLAWLAGAYVPWVAMFAIYRYLIGLELLAPLGLVLLLDRLGLSGRRLAWTACGLFVVVLVTLRFTGWGHVPWSAHHFGVEPPALTAPSRTIVLLPATEPTAFVVPFFPREVRFVRVSRWDLDSPQPPNGMERLARDTVARHDGIFHALFRMSERAIAVKALQQRGLRLESDRCERLVVRAEMHRSDGLLFCPVERLP